MQCTCKSFCVGQCGPSTHQLDKWLIVACLCRCIMMLLMIAVVVIVVIIGCKVAGVGKVSVPQPNFGVRHESGYGLCNVQSLWVVKVCNMQSCTWTCQRRANMCAWAASHVGCLSAGVSSATTILFEKETTACSGRGFERLPLNYRSSLRVNKHAQ